MNPLTAIPAKARLVVYALLTLGALALAAWQAADGDWLVFASLLLGSLGFGTAASNVDLPHPAADVVDEEDDADYEDGIPGDLGSI